MLKRILLIGVIGVVGAAIQGDRAEAHLAGTIYSPVYRHIASYDCTGTFAQVPSLTQHPAFFECSAIVRSYQFTCKNPKGKVVTPGLPSGPWTVGQFAQDFITEDDLDEKVKGKASLTLKLPDTVLEDADAACADRNRRWTAAAELVTVVDVWLKSYDCEDDLEIDPTCANRSQASESYLRCTVPPQYSLPDNPPPGNPDNPVPTEYNCELIDEAHCDQGELCPIPPVAYVP